MQSWNGENLISVVLIADPCFEHRELLSIAILAGDSTDKTADDVAKQLNNLQGEGMESTVVLLGNGHLQRSAS